MDLLDIPKSELMDRSTGLPKINSNDGSGCVMGFEKKSSLSSFLWNKSSGKMGDTPLDKPAIVQSETAKVTMAPDSLKSFIGVGDTSLFSSSLPATFHKMSDMPECIGKVTETSETGEELLDPLEEMESRMIRSMLPDDDELLAGIVDGFDNLYLPNSKDESEDFDLFSSVGGLELDGGPQEGFGKHMNRNGGSDNRLSGVSEPGSVIGEHPYGEHPSRTLFVRNINSNVEDAELQALFEQYGDIRTLYTACKHRGFVMVSYYDIRAARSAIKGLYNKPLRHRNLDIHFSIPKDNPSDKDINQGTLVVFNLDASVSNDVLRQIFGAYGEVKEIRETPHKRHHKFVEFYDVRDADAALRALNKTEIAGKRIKVEPSRPGGARRSLMQMLSQELEQEEIRGHLSQVGSPVANSPPGYPSHWSHVSSPVDSAFVRGINQPVGLGTIVHSVNKSLLDLSVTAAYSSSLRVGTIGSHLGRGGPTESNGISGQYGLDMKQVMGEGHHPHSFPEYSSTMMPFGKQVVTPSSSSHAFIEGLEGIRVPRTSRGTGNEASLFEHSPGAIGSHISSGSFTGSQFLWGNSNPYHESVQSSSPGMWSTSKPVISHGHSPHQSLGYSGTLGHFSNMAMSTHTHHHHVGSAPSGDLSAVDRHYGHFGESPDIPFLRPGSYGTAGIIRNNNNNNNSNASSSPPVMRIGGHMLGTAMGMILPQRGLHNMFQTTGSLSSASASMEGLTDHGRLRSSRTENSASQLENKKQYLLDLERIAKGEDTRTTLMIKNIPNKYTSKMLLATIDEKHRGTYDFLYLPIDFKNKCNVGYAFINMTSPCHIVPFYETFNGKKWDKFNSEKVASLAYARIQGKSALVAHFQNSSLMNEDKRCRPILFRSHGPEAGEEEPFPSGLNIRPKSSKDQIASGDFLDMPYILTTKDDCVPGAALSFSPEGDQN